MLHPKYRSDIDGLRAIAVLAVVIFHAFPSALPGGFIGVDVFFVISGYLITQIIVKNLSQRTFHLIDFYQRRIRRIFPALSVILIASLCLGWALLLPDELTTLGKHTAGGAAFIANLLYWHESGYFDAGAHTKPLLHLWSLGVEEQFYLVWPLLLWGALRLRIQVKHSCVVIGALSFAANLWLFQSDSVADFFSPISRFWELALGGYLACRFLEHAHTTPRNDSLSTRGLETIGLIILALGLALISSDSLFPGLWALLPTLGAAALLQAGQTNHQGKLLSHPALVWVGSISYPLYLWHWPLLVYLSYAVGHPSPFLRGAVVAFAILLSWLTARYVERPLRFGNFGQLKSLALILLMALIAMTGFAISKSDGFPNRTIAVAGKSVNDSIQWVELWDNHHCTETYHIGPCLISKPNPSVMILGDSHANHLYPGLTTFSDAGFFAGGTCPPLLDVTMYVSKNQSDHPCAQHDFVRQNLDILDQTPSIHTVIISTYWRPVLDGQILNEAEKQRWGSSRLQSAYPQEQEMERAQLVRSGLVRTIEALKQRGKRVVIVRDTPELVEDIRSYCFNRMALLTHTATEDCTIDRAVIEAYRLPEDRLMASIQSQFPDVTIIDPIDTFCDSTRCYVMQGNVPLLRDQHHLSIPGSQRLGRVILHDAGLPMSPPLQTSP